VGDASDSNGHWIDVVRNKKGVKQNKKKANEISNFKMPTVPKGAHLIDLAVAPKANDQTHQARAKQKKKMMSSQGKSVKKQHADVLDALSVSKFQTLLLTGIKKAEVALTKESDTITKNLEILQTSVQRSAQLLLVKKGLVRQLKEFELKRLPKNWNEFWVKYDKTLPRDLKANQKNVMNKILEQQTNLIDGERKFVGELDVKVFHSVHKKKDWDKFHSKTVIDWENVPELNEDDSDYILAASSDSDNSIMADEGDWSYFGIETVPPNPCHHCQFRGHR
jgi:hypothetical protein